MTTQTRSLYDRLGGGDAISALTQSWVARVGGDDRANGKFARTDIERLMKEVVDQLCEVTGGPCTYTGRSMLETHAGMQVTAGEFEVVVVVQPKQTSAAAESPEDRGWPPGYFENTFGSITDDTFVRPPQGELPQPLDLE